MPFSQWECANREPESKGMTQAVRMCFRQRTKDRNGEAEKGKLESLPSLSFRGIIFYTERNVMSLVGMDFHRPELDNTQFSVQTFFFLKPHREQILSLFFMYSCFVLNAVTISLGDIDWTSSQDCIVNSCFEVSLCHRHRVKYLKFLKERSIGISNIAQIKVLITKPDDISSTPWDPQTNNSLKLSSDTCTCMILPSSNKTSRKKIQKQLCLCGLEQVVVGNNTMN